MAFNGWASYGCSFLIILLTVVFQYVAANSTHQNGPGNSSDSLQTNHQLAVNALLDGLIRDKTIVHNVTATSGSEARNSSLVSDAVLSLLLQMQNRSGFPGNWTGLGNLLSMNRTGRGDDYGGSSYGGWGGSYNGGGYGGEGYGGGNGLELLALLGSRRHNEGPPPQQDQQSSSDSSLGSTALLTLLGLALISRMPTQ